MLLNLNIRRFYGSFWFWCSFGGEHDDVPPAPFVRNPYNYNVMAVSNETGLKCEDPSLAQQQFKEETDVNYIVDRYTRTGELPPGSQIPQFGDFTGVSDYHSALNLVRQSQEEFMSLPPAVRSRFENDPGKLLDFLTDDKTAQKRLSSVLLSLRTYPRLRLLPLSSRQAERWRSPLKSGSFSRHPPYLKGTNLFLRVILGFNGG